MTMRQRSQARLAGFTLVEMVMVIIVVGIIGASLVMFMKPAIESYADSRRRAGLSDKADTALRRIAREVRTAVPNSIRTPNNQCFELVPTSTGGRYRMQADTTNDAPTCPTSGTCSAPLDTAQPTTAFDVLSQLSAVPVAGDWVVVGNQDANDVYAGTTSALIGGVAAPPNASFGLQRITLAVPQQFPVGYDGGRFSVVAANAGQPAVFYICEGGTLRRLTRAFDSTYPASCPSAAGAPILADKVSNCSFTYSPSVGESQQRGFVEMYLELSDGGESVSLSFGAHVDNVP